MLLLRTGFISFWNYIKDSKYYVVAKPDFAFNFTKAVYRKEA